MAKETAKRNPKCWSSRTAVPSPRRRLRRTEVDEAVEEELLEEEDQGERPHARRQDSAARIFPRRPLGTRSARVRSRRAV